MPEIIEQHIVVETDNLNALECLYQNTELSKQQIKRSMQNGALWLENARGVNRLRRAKKDLQKGEVLHLYYDEEIQVTTPPEAKMIADMVDYSIWYKPSGMYSQGSKWGDHCSINRWVESHLKPQRPAFIVHRLDRATSGLMILAHKKKVAKAFSEMFEQRKIRKIYHARVEGIYKPEKLPSIIKQSLDGKEAMTEVLSVEHNMQFATTDVTLRIITGRKHQIRRHMSTLGHPVQGDRLYGALNVQLDLQLSCKEIGFECPISGKSVFWSLEK